MNLPSRKPMTSSLSSNRPAMSSNQQAKPTNTVSNKTQDSDISLLMHGVDLDQEIKSGLEGVIPVLNYVGFKSYYMKPDENNPVEQIFVSTNLDFLPNDFDEQPLLQIMYVSDFAKAMEDEPIEGDISPILQFFVTLPINELSNQKKSEIHELLSVATKLCHIGHFSYNNIDGLFYRYSAMFYDKNIDDGLIVEAVQNINFLLNVFYEKIKLFINTDITLPEVIEDIEKVFFSKK